MVHRPPETRRLRDSAITELRYQLRYTSTPQEQQSLRTQLDFWQRQ